MKVFTDSPYVEPYVWEMTDEELHTFIDDLAFSRHKTIEHLIDLPFCDNYYRTLLDDCGHNGWYLQSVQHIFLKYLNSAECRMQLGLEPTCEQLRLVATRGGTEFRWGKFLYPGNYEIGEAHRVQKLALKCCKMHLISFSRSLAGFKWDSQEMQCVSERNTASVERTTRNVNPSKFVKDLYGGQCQKCEMVLHAPNGPIAEAAHIIEVRSNGPDEVSNLFCLCPNCHKALDANAWAPKFDGKDLVAISYDNSEKHKSMILHEDHGVAREAIDWRFKQFSPRSGIN